MRARENGVEQLEMTCTGPLRPNRNPKKTDHCAKIADLDMQWPPAECISAAFTGPGGPGVKKIGRCVCFRSPRTLVRCRGLHDPENSGYMILTSY